MNQKSHSVLLLGVLIVSISGCRSSTEQYKRLTQAGIAYSDSVENLISFAGDTQINSTSEKILVLCKPPVKPLAVETCTSSYDTLSQDDASYLDALDLLSRQTHLLRRYFTVLGTLASFGDTTTVQTAKDDADNIAESLNTLGTEIKANHLVKKGLLGDVTQLLVSNSVRGALGEELRFRKSTLTQVLNYQEILIKILGDGIRADLLFIRSAQENRLKDQLIVEPNEEFNSDDWIKKRQEILSFTQQNKEFDEASAREMELRTAFKEIVGGNIDREKINRVITEINSSPVLLPRQNADK
ncbi:hypothetical protein [Nostoc sp.]|uniref:hypothetical protein n=1 Tax=Nostoc sp. TaxID=1180 RepID=UPI002FFB39D8